MPDLFENPIGLDGFEFVEFCAPEKGVVEPVFKAMGFTHVASHRSKDVDLWRQGQINLILNYEPRSAAWFFAREHGPSACGMGFRVRDARKAYDELIERGAEPVAVETGPMELRIPAIRGIGGAIVYLIDRYADENGEYPYAFGGDPKNPLQTNVEETIQFVELLDELGIELVNMSAASPYYNPHLMRPATFPPSDGYQPPEDPLVGVARQVNFHGQVAQKFPHLATVGTGYSYLQEWLPNVGQYNVRNGLINFVGLGRMVLSYPEFAADVLAGKPLDRKHICRTFSDCTTAPRNGMISGCFPLDDFYKGMPQADLLKDLKLES